MGQGQTLQTISTHCARSQLALQQLNKLADPNAITAGQVYQIYDNLAPAPAPGGGSGSSTGGELDDLSWGLCRQGAVLLGLDMHDSCLVLLHWMLGNMGLTQGSQPVLRAGCSAHMGSQASQNVMKYLWSTCLCLCLMMADLALQQPCELLTRLGLQLLRGASWGVWRQPSSSLSWPWPLSSGSALGSGQA